MELGFQSKPLKAVLLVYGVVGGCGRDVVKSKLQGAGPHGSIPQNQGFFRLLCRSSSANSWCNHLKALQSGAQRASLVYKNREMYRVTVSISRANLVFINLLNLLMINTNHLELRATLIVETANIESKVHELHRYYMWSNIVNTWVQAKSCEVRNIIQNVRMSRKIRFLSPSFPKVLCYGRLQLQPHITGWR